MLLHVQDAFGYVVFGTVIVGVIVALVTFAMSSRAYDQIGEGGFYSDDEAGSRAAGGDRSGGAVDVADRDAEIRQMLTARNARRAAAGRESVDVEEELARLVAPSIDVQLREEMRDHVVARNARRVRKGQEPLDVDAEVERQVRDLGG